MAHWIIKDLGFGGQIYRCSECECAWNDLYVDVGMVEHCPACEAPINDDENEYID